MRTPAAIFLLSLLLLSPAPALAGGVCGDVNDTGSVNASDALGVLKRGVGQDNVLACPPAGQPVRTGQFQQYGSDSDGASKLGAPRTFVDNGDGTITDFGTGLMWEKKDDALGIHDKNRAFSWSKEGSQALDGTLATEFLATLNADGGFAGHTDWRIPNRAELMTIQNLAFTNHSVHAPFRQACVALCTFDSCACIQAGDYWTSTTSAADPAEAWTVGFFNSEVSLLPKTEFKFSVAVRTADATPNAPTCKSPDPPQCSFGDPCTLGVCSITREPCSQQANCPLSPNEECCCQGSCI